MSKARARITSHSSGPADAGRLTPALCKTEKFKTQRQSLDWAVPGFVDNQFGGLFSWVVISLKQAKDGGNFNLSVSSRRLCFQAGS